MIAKPATRTPTTSARKIRVFTLPVSPRTRTTSSPWSDPSRTQEGHYPRGSWRYLHAGHLWRSFGDVLERHLMTWLLVQWLYSPHTLTVCFQYHLSYVVLEMGDGDVGVLQIAFRKVPDRSSSQRELDARKLPVLVNRGRPRLEVIPSLDRAVPLRHEVGDLPLFIEVHRRADALATICERHSGRFVVYGLEGDIVVQESGGEPDHFGEVAHHRPLVHLWAFVVHDGEERACLDEHPPLAARVRVSPPRYWRRAFVDSDIPHEAGWLHRVVLLRVKRHPPLFGAQVHLSLLLEINGIHRRFANDPCVLEVAPHRLGEVLEHLFGDDRLSCGRGSSGEECLDVPLYQAVEPPEP